MTFVSLKTHSYYSFLDGASSPEALVQRAASLNMTALALTDLNGFYGVIPFYRECQRLGIKPIIGATLTIEGDDQITLLCINQAGYRDLSQLITRSYAGRDKGDLAVTLEQIAAASGHLIALVGSPESLLARLIQRKDLSHARTLLKSYQDSFLPSQLYVALSLLGGESDTTRCKRLAQLAAEQSIPVVATNNIRYATQEEGTLHDVLRCIKAGVTLDNAHHVIAGNHHCYLKDPGKMQRLFHRYLDAVNNSIAIADRCHVSLDFSCYRFPSFEVPESETVDSYLHKLCLENIPTKYTPPTIATANERLSHELQLIAKLGLSGYFLIVWDLVQFARSKNIPVQGRGSAANSIVAYILGITPVDPIAYNLFLGRFLHDEMTSMPDIDLDFASTRDPSETNREDVIQYVYKKYGANHVAMVCTFITFQGRSAIREVGKVLGMPSHLLDKMARVSGHHSPKTAMKELTDTKEFIPLLASKKWELFTSLVEKIAHIPRHISIHVGGMVIASTLLADLVPLEPGRMENRIVCQWDKDMIEDAGLIKIDILGLGMLAVLRETCHLISESTGVTVDLEKIPADDPQVYKQIAEADTVGVFQVESRAQMQSLPRTKPQNFEELGVQVAIIRPGPLQGNMVTPYIKRKQGIEPVTYLHPSLEPILKETLGVILFQEQVLKVAVVAAGFTPAQADALRRAMSRKRSQEAMEALRQQFIQGAAEREICEMDATTIFSTLEGFALYGFCKSHALSFARIAYVSGWLKQYHPIAFVAALLNNQPMGFYSNESLIEDAKRHGIEVREVDINRSRKRCHVEEGALRLGFILVNGLNDEATEMILKVRQTEGSFQSLRHFMATVNIISMKGVESLIEAGAFDSLGLERRELLWQLWLLQKEGTSDNLATQSIQPPPLPTSSQWTLMKGEYRAIGFAPQRHPMKLLRPKLPPALARSSDLKSLEDGASVLVAGVVSCLQKPPTAKGFAFITLEDEFNMMNVIVRPDLYKKERSLIRQEPILIIRGTLQKQEGILNIQANRIYGALMHVEIN